MRSKNRSIRKRIATAIIGVVIGVIALVCILNTTLLGFFYTLHKTDNMIKAYNVIDSGARSMKLYEDDFELTLEKLASNENLSFLVMSSDGTVIISSQDHTEFLLSQMYMTMLGENDDRFWGSEETENYSIRKIRDDRFGEEYLVLLGTLSDGNIIMMRTAIAGMKESAIVTNRFILAVGLLAIGVAGLVAFFLSRVMERTIEELQDENAKLARDIALKEESEKMRKEFISNVSHELKTPIAVIQGYAEGLADDVAEDPESRKYYADVIVDEAGRMNTMVRQLLALNQLEYGESNITMGKVHLNELMASVVSANEILASQNNVAVKLKDMPEIFVLADEFFTEQVFTNYLTNAIHYAKNEKIVSIKVIDQDKDVRVCVFNTGDPIPEEAIEHIWEKFYKVDAARTREYGGSGIGLSVVKAVMDSYKKECGVTNFDNGVEFWFELDKYHEEQ
ncbi:MAG: HAMP domain-containing histidine kinase [Lachnospiraceae bacterium]|nr:HAMP domain-containing histidine kinase [Lachnospiraceae bacterium]